MLVRAAGFTLLPDGEVKRDFVGCGEGDAGGFFLLLLLELLPKEDSPKKMLGMHLKD